MDKTKILNDESQTWKIEFDKIDKLHDPQRFVSATFDKEYVTFFKVEKPVDEPEVIAKTDCIRSLLAWVDNPLATRVYGFDCTRDNRANVFSVTWAERWVVLHFTDKNRVVHHAFLSIKSLRKLVKELKN